MSPEPSGATVAGSVTGSVAGIDHVALPMRNTDAMITFYRSLGLSVVENPYLVRIQLGVQTINFHWPELWQGDFSLRASAAHPPCGDLCLVWQGSEETLRAPLHRADAAVVEGPVEREGWAPDHRFERCIVYDPDGNLIEFITYPEERTEDAGRN